MRAGFAFILVLSCLGLNGCGGGAPTVGVTTTPVKGKVTYKGQPLTSGTVNFEPNGGREAYGDIKSDGTYELTTYKPGDGAVLGPNRVQISNMAKAGKQTIPAKYKNYTSSKIEVEVSTEKTDYPIELK